MAATDPPADGFPISSHHRQPLSGGESHLRDDDPS